MKNLLIIFFFPTLIIAQNHSNGSDGNKNVSIKEKYDAIFGKNSHGTSKQKLDAAKTLFELTQLDGDEGEHYCFVASLVAVVDDDSFENIDKIVASCNTCRRGVILADSKSYKKASISRFMRADVSTFAKYDAAVAKLKKR